MSHYVPLRKGTQALKKRGLVKNTDGKWAAAKARARRAPSLSGVSADEIKAAA
jgi:hypothetical protein